jgi:hypothetical protein
MSADPIPQIERKPYDKPKLRKLTEEQSRLLLLGHASVGNEDAKELLKIFYPDEDATS